MTQDDRLLSKMDALMRRHRGETAASESDTETTTPASAVNPPPAWLPVLTQVIERGSIPATPNPAEAHAPNTSAVALASTPAPSPHEPVDPEALLQTLLPRLGENLKQQLTLDVHNRVDRALAAFRVELEARLRETLQTTHKD